MTEPIRKQLRSLPRPLLVALDVDGTLAPIVEHPDDAEIPSDTLRILRRLSDSPDCVLAFITGRDTETLRKMTKSIRAWSATQHGRTVLAPGETQDMSGLAHNPQLKALEEWLHDHAQDALLEKKPLSIAVHVRQLQHKPRRAAEILETASAEGLRLGLCVRHGRAMCEFEEEHGDKAAALDTINKRSGAASVFYAGDDLTDFAAIEYASVNGVGVFVASHERPIGPSNATATLQGPSEFAAVLDALCD